MELLKILGMIVFAISSVLLILVVLAQDDQGESLGALFGGGGPSVGASSGNFLTKITTILAFVFIALSFGLAYVSRSTDAGTVLEEAKVIQAREIGDQEWWNEQEASPPASDSGKTPPPEKREEGGS